MQKRNTQQRRDDIVEWVNQTGHVHVDEMAARFGTSQVTIRKDLAALAHEKRVLREFGGAAPMPASSPATTPNVVVGGMPSAKAGIGKRAAEFVSDGDKLIIDCGNTTAALLPFLTQNKLVVMTNSLHAANTLTAASNEPTVLMTGGTWDAHSQSFQGNMAEKMISAYSFDTAFIGASGLDVERGSTTLNELTGLSKAMANVARRVVVLAESNKFFHRMPNLELPWEDIDMLITDANISDQIKQQLEARGVTLMVTPVEGDSSCVE
ncbi:DeoR/GlpR family DNA-binding transcription regulator [Aestuariibacter sp. A3R04]|uniref:DeoR/GlpR family DNA-binding transcription regulator n=1 Tax=Aestuariibacter sp. A3R04 TaxID=2841571 RepID=UPI001C087EA5|nr:DeoR family transcriptional regulator [Aestuariibacter sp. A3R04]MBU3020462.1 DeoR family transcriptional regulator [Aestuariibacter sp. A3R04]